MKPWARLEIGYLNHPKFLSLNANAICLWHEGKNYCDAQLTDGVIPRDALKTFRFRGAKAIQQLLTSCGQKPNGEAYAPLWDEIVTGYRMHDYIEHNDTRDEIMARLEKADDDRDWEKRRKRLIRDQVLTAEIRRRDCGACRYCGRLVNWHDRRGPDGATYDHVHPRGDNTLENVVVACRGCNTIKGSRTPEDAGMCLRPVPNQAGSSPNLAATKPVGPGRLLSSEAETVTSTAPIGAVARARGPIVDQRTHRQHAHCGRVCLHASLFSEFVRRRNHETADDEIRDWAMQVERDWAHSPDEPGDAFDFWRARYAERWPASDSKKPASWRGHERAPGDYEADNWWLQFCLHDPKCTTEAQCSELKRQPA